MLLRTVGVEKSSRFVYYFISVCEHTSLRVGLTLDPSQVIVEQVSPQKFCPSELGGVSPTSDRCHEDPHAWLSFSTTQPLYVISIPGGPRGGGQIYEKCEKLVRLKSKLHTRAR